LTSLSFGIRLSDERAQENRSNRRRRPGFACADDFLGIYIRMYVREHPPPHFHAVYGEFEANVSIAAGEVIEGRLPRNAVRLVKEWTARHRAELESNWRRAEAGRAPERIAGLDADEGA
jgi:Domain of unknown function (DUF4160)